MVSDCKECVHYRGMTSGRTEHIESANLETFMTRKRKIKFIVTKDLLMKAIEEKRKKDEEWLREEAERVGING